MDLIKYLFEKPVLVGRMARWLLLLAEFELKFITRKSLKGRAVAEFLANFPVQGAEDQEFKFLDKAVMQTTEDVWQLYFDGASNQNGFGVRILIVAPDDAHIFLAFKLYFGVTNNEAEYEACIIRLQAAIELNAEVMEVI